MITQTYNYTACDRTTINGKRHYCLPDGSKVPSVTTVLDKTKSEESVIALANWRRNVGEKKAQEIVTEAAGRGTRMHKWLENYVINDKLEEPGSNPFSQQSHQMANVIIDNAFKHCDTFWGTELPLYYSGLYAGTTDLAGLWKGKEAILDFKQTNKPKKREYIDDYFVQLLMYGTAHNHMHNTNIKTGVVLMCSKDFEYQEFVIDGAEWDRYERIMWDRIEAYYKLG